VCHIARDRWAVLESQPCVEGNVMSLTGWGVLLVIAVAVVVAIVIIIRLIVRHTRGYD
jgi:hypothetical protein